MLDLLFQSEAAGEQGGAVPAAAAAPGPPEHELGPEAGEHCSR